ncbi:DUF1367 family protein [Methylorubrum suomiense]|uniref:DUF1367 family protein n=1 Tax=Methylorubrum suomiense TaxID=144191 RepID=A0ABQ4UY34_9HYPH|nr:DUF1367 family protein [Methylorubrum suomiense]GJE77205.1 hypothetical protein BGCPKDLD_3808 [Methylorubrum suomiense]
MSDLEGRLFIRRAQGFVPADIMAEDAMNKVAVGSTVMLTVRRPRNPAHHRKLFALFSVVLEQTDRWADSTVLLEDLKLATGLFETRVSALTGMPYPVPASISFAAMSQDRFEAWYAKAIRVLSEHLGTDVEALGREVAEAAAASARRAA